MVKKQLYSAPEAELLVVGFEENILSGGGIQDITGNDVEDDSEDWG